MQTLVAIGGIEPGPASVQFGGRHFRPLFSHRAMAAATIFRPFAGARAPVLATAA